MNDRTLPDKKKKILMFMPSSTGGAERMTINISKMLIKAGFSVKIAIVDHEIGNIESFIPQEVEKVYIRCKHIPFSFIDILRIIKREKPHKTFCSLGHLAPYVILASRLCRVPVIIRNDLSMAGASRLTLFLRKVTYPFVQWNISQTDEMKEEYINTLKLNPQRCLTLQNPVDKELIEEKIKGVESPYPRGNSQTNFLWVGRFHYDKGQDLLAKAFKLVLHTKEDSHLYFVGKFIESDPYFLTVKEFVKDIEDRVHFVGFDSNPYKWMKYADCFVLPSRVEGLPNALIEAMYLGRPVVATRCLPVIDRIVDNGENGFIVPMDEPREMADAMLKALKLKNCVLDYQSASEDDYIKLFR